MKTKKINCFLHFAEKYWFSYEGKASKSVL
jgi:hypothetical protein